MLQPLGRFGNSLAFFLGLRFIVSWGVGDGTRNRIEHDFEKVVDNRQLARRKPIHKGVNFLSLDTHGTSPRDDSHLHYNGILLALASPARSSSIVENAKRLFEKTYLYVLRSHLTGAKVEFETFETACPDEVASSTRTSGSCSAAFDV